MLRWIATSVVIVLGAASSASATAETLDPTQGVCEALLEATEGLYDLCLEYCEASCDVSTLGNVFFLERVSQCLPAEPEILEKYRQRMHPGDPRMPCVKR